MTALSRRDRPRMATEANEPLLEVAGLNVVIEKGGTRLSPVQDVSFTLRRGEVVGLVGESGSGKTMTALSILGLLPQGARISVGKVGFMGMDLSVLPPHKMQRIRGREIAYVPQDATAALNPLLRIGTQLEETLHAHQRLDRKEAHNKAAALLSAMGIPDPVARLAAFPHELSGGMRQRVCIAIAISCDPVFIIADEPTTALDVTVQAQILDLLVSAATERDAAILLISHDLRMVATVTDRVMVMYAGRLVEVGATERVITDPRHPYTQALLLSTPRLTGPRLNRLRAIRGSVPNLRALPAGCRFHPRCMHARARCAEQEPLLDSDTSVACWFPLSRGLRASASPGETADER
jgi:peptide/nickel transport system ATP-binding protein